jgi:hypothetical protein
MASKFVFVGVICRVCWLLACVAQAAPTVRGKLCVVVLLLLLRSNACIVLHLGLMQAVKNGWLVSQQQCTGQLVPLVLHGYPAVFACGTHFSPS